MAGGTGNDNYRVDGFFTETTDIRYSTTAAIWSRAR